MNYDAPRKRESDGKWHYTSMNDGRIWAIGYCSPHDICPDCKEHLPMSVEQRACKTCGGKGLVPKADPCPGHDTPDEACEHYKQYLLDTGVHFNDDEAEPRQLNRCEADGCKEMTSGSATVGAWCHFILCSEHRNRETLEKMIKVGESWHN